MGSDDGLGTGQARRSLLTAAEAAVMVSERIADGIYPDGPIWQLSNDLAVADAALRAKFGFKPGPADR